MYSNRTAHRSQVVRIVFFLFILVPFLFSGLTVNAAQPDPAGPLAGTINQIDQAPPMPAPKRSAAMMPSAPSNPRTGYRAPEMLLTHLTGQMPKSDSPQVLPDAYDWRDVSGQSYVTSVKNQAACGSCYSFASLGNFESKLLIDSAGTFDFSENNAKECNWRELNNYTSGGNPWGSCDGGNYFMLASLFSQKGTVLESCDPYVAADVACNSSCAYQKTLLDWRIISGDAIPSPEVLKQYIYDHGPVYTSMYADDAQGFSAYDGSYTFNYSSPTGNANHAVLIIGWSNALPPVPGGSTPATGWIVKNSWGPGWGANGYFYITYGAANIGLSSSYISEWQDYDSTGGLLYYDDDGWTSGWGWGDTTAWGMAKFIPPSSTSVKRVEFWTSDITTDVDVYLYDSFDGTNLSGLLASKLNLSYSEAGYHSALLDSPVAVAGGNDIFAVVHFVNSSYGYPIVADENGPIETGKTYISHTGSGGWTDLGSGYDNDVAIRLRTGAAANTPPTISSLPDQMVPTNGSQNNAIDLWAYTSDLESADSALAFTINNSPNPSAGVTIDSNRYVDIFPNAGWSGQTDVEIKVSDPGGLFDTDTFQVSVISAKTWTGSLNADWHTASNWDPAGVPTVADNVIIPNMANDPVISGGDAAVNSLTINAGAVLDLTNRLLTVEGSVTNNGTLKQTLLANQSVTTNFLRLTNQAQTQTKYYGLDFTASSSTSVTVNISGNQFCQGRTAGVKRCYDIAPAAAQTATVRFYLTEAERNGAALNKLKVFHYSGSWTQETGTTTYGGSGDAQYVQAQNISDFSPFALDEPAAPKTFLPLVVRRQPPAAPVLNPIPTPNTTGSYVVSWSAVSKATSYTLQEDTSNTFPHPTQVYNGASTSWNASGKTNGIYCYRVRANNAIGSSAWSSAQCVTVSVPPGPTPGYWSGTGVELYVTTDRQYVDNFAVTIYVSGCGTYKITRTTDVPITNNQFSFTGSFYASGTFTSSTSVNGSGGFNHFYLYGCGYITGPFTWSATWKNSSPPSFIPQEVTRLEGDREALRNFEPAPIPNNK